MSWMRELWHWVGKVALGWHSGKGDERGVRQGKGRGVREGFEGFPCPLYGVREGSGLMRKVERRVSKGTQFVALGEGEEGCGTKGEVKEGEDRGDGEVTVAL